MRGNHNGVGLSEQEAFQLTNIAEYALKHEVTTEQLMQATATAIQVDSGSMPLADDYVAEIVFDECMQSSKVQTWSEKLGFSKAIGSVNDAIR
ncbi:hypothetical protein [Vreelandella neptunia]|uniref:Uncharacterized protein n=1 Tax=Vreelandella neptunia TaxID=115551 RepID=A0ABS9S3H0_9GAMM|nr:hypothetical protein [Halomonas neptunia]MCH4810675.1 hypothetical protein [Halomonas neptunia]